MKNQIGEPPCSAELLLADELEMTATQHADNGDADYGKPLMNAALALRRLVTSLMDANDQCRSAFQIANRSGEDTNWETFRTRLDESLGRQHHVMHSPNKP